MATNSGKDRRRHIRFPIIQNISEEAKMYLSPPLIMNPLPVTLNELSCGGMKFFTTSPIPTRFLFAIVFNTPFAKKIYAEAKILHVNKVDDGYMVGASFVNIKPEMREKIDLMAQDYNVCEETRKYENKDFCKTNCAYMPICEKNVKPDAASSKQKKKRK